MTPNHTSSRRRAVYGLLPPLVALAACTALPQAALIYSSRVSGGLDISGGATDTQGVSLNIGFKTTDLAYVPVAVGASAPGGGLGPLTPLSASHGVGINAEAFDRLPEKNKERIAAHGEALVKLKQALNDVKSVQGNLAQAEAKSSEAAAAAAAMPTDPAKKAVAEKAGNDLTQKKTLLAEKEAAVEEAKKTVATRLAEAAESFGMLQSRSVDAMSVYGQFNGAGAGSTPGASSPASGQLAVGRVFSTGVAAQNLTQAVQQEARSLCIARLNELVARAGEPASQAALASKVTELCPANGAMH